MGNKGRGEKTKMNKGRREGQGERANNNKEFSYVFVWCLFRSLIGPKSGQNPKKKKHPNLQPHKQPQETPSGDKQPQHFCFLFFVIHKIMISSSFTRLLVSSSRPFSIRSFSSSSSLFSGPLMVTLNYQEMIPGRKVGR